MAADALGAVPVNVDIIGYRDWARKLHYYVKNGLALRHNAYWFESTAYRTGVDLTFLVGWSEIVPPEFYKDRTVLVLHPSPLPFYRGGSPIQHQIINGEDHSAVSLFRLDEAHPDVDSGPLAWQQGYSLEGTLPQILERIAKVGARGALDVIAAAEDSTLSFWEQPEIDWVPKYRRRTPAESEVSAWEMANLTARQIHDKVRALGAPYPNAYWTAADGKRVYITETWLDGKDE